MSVIKQFIIFLKENKKLLERGVKDILNSNISKNFIWIDDIEKLKQSNICESNLTEIFNKKHKLNKLIFSLQKPLIPAIDIPKEYIQTIIFNEDKLVFESNNNLELELQEFKSSSKGKKEIERVKEYKFNKELYSKLYRAFNDLKNDSNKEIVLSSGLIQLSRVNKNGKLSKTNQHLFHFPLSLSINSDNIIEISFSDSEIPYVDFFFLNNTPIEKELLTNLIDKFDNKISESGFKYFFDEEFNALISKEIQTISSNSTFEDSIHKPLKDSFKEDYFKILYSPAINIKAKKPRVFEKLTDSIVNYNENSGFQSPLLNLLLSDSNTSLNNSDIKENYFRDELYETYKDKIQNLKNDEDFSVFFPLPFNKEQKKIYENYLENKLTVVTGPPGTGKSHTIVNILCTLIAQGKRVLVTAQTDKALESLLDKIPNSFDDLIFTKIQLETNKNRFSLEKSIDNISTILRDDFYFNIENKIDELDSLKGEYVSIKREIIHALDREYELININESFRNLRAFQIVEKFESKRNEEWTWIQDIISEEVLSDFEKLQKKIFDYKELENTEIRYSNSVNNNILNILKKLEAFDFNSYLESKKEYNLLLQKLSLTEDNKNSVLAINFDKLIQITQEYTSSDIILKKGKQLNELISKIKVNFTQKDLRTNKTFDDLIQNSSKYLADIETYVSLIKNEKVGFLTRVTNSTFKEVSYLEKFTINSKKCETKDNILQLQYLIKSLSLIKQKFNLIQQEGFTVYYSEDSNLSEKIESLNEIIERVKRNQKIISEIEFNEDFILFSKYFNRDIYELDSLYKDYISIKSDFQTLNILNNKLKDNKEILREVNSLIIDSSIEHLFKEKFPIYSINKMADFESVKSIFLEVGKQIEIEQKFLELKESLQDILPNTFNLLKNVPNEYILKENFNFKTANEFIKNNRDIDLQKHKLQLSSINKKIFEIKCDILFDLAKSNFKQKFSKDSIDEFISLLERYKYNLSQSSRKIRDQSRFQNLARKNSIEISKKLSCWVMKFNDVLDSVSHEPEIFDCIIVDEASQLDFNSMLLGYYAKSMIIVGDDKQTSPSSLSSADGNDFEAIKNKYLDFLGDNIIHVKNDNSLFSLSKMVAGSSNLMLKEHFRCVPEIIEFSKLHFYNNSLRPLKQLNSNRLNPKEAIHIEDAFSEEQVVYGEIKEIKTFLDNFFVDEKYKNKSVGVVSLGRSKHTEKLKDIKEDLSFKYGKEKIDYHKLIIEDSPKFQGDERDVMIVSLGVALDYQKLKENQNAKPRAIIDNQDDKKKINVALSRAKEQMILFHSVKSEDLQPKDFRNEIINFFYEGTKPISQLIIEDFNIERFRHNVPQPFDSWFEYDIAQALIERGFSYIQPQFKVKEDETFFNHKLGKETYVNFKIDLVVHNNGKMIAIECDGDPFHSLPEDVAYDVERQEFLERVGWKVYRILYSAYKRNPSEEVDKIIEFIECQTKSRKI